MIAAGQPAGGDFGKVSLKVIAKICSAIAIVVVVIMALGPENWQLRSGLGWGFDHFFGYFVITALVCIAWPRPLIVGLALMVFSSGLEGLQAFTPDRSANALAALAGASGALTAAVLAGLFMWIVRRWSGSLPAGHS